MTVVNQNIYALGGADYNADAFFTETDRHGKTKRLGARLLTLDTDHLEKGWTELPPCPGTPRWVHAFAAVGKTLYLIGGASGNVVIDGQSYGYCTVVDNWSFNLDTQKWSRLRDLPVSSGNFPKSSQLVYNNRYLILPGGHQYAHVLNPDGSIRDKYGQASSANPKSGLHNDVFVYDTKTNRFGAADPLPIDNNLPTTVVRGNKIYLMGGETGGGFIQNEYYGHHPDLLLIGTISKPATR
jgi:N-acetylneuraminic acid mutarotase